MSRAPIAEIQAWFSEHGYWLEFRKEADHHWADLVSLATKKVLAPRYGSGDSDISAANRAKARYQEEE